MMLGKLIPWRAECKRRVKEARAVADAAEARLLNTRLDSAVVDFLSERLDRMIERESRG